MNTNTLTKLLLNPLFPLTQLLILKSIVKMMKIKFDQTIQLKRRLKRMTGHHQIKKMIPLVMMIFQMEMVT